MESVDLMTMLEAATYLTLPYKTLANNYKIWSVPHYKLGPGTRTGVYFRQCDLDTWLETRRVA